MKGLRNSSILGLLLGSSVLLAIGYHLFVFLFEVLKTHLAPYLLR